MVAERNKYRANLSSLTASVEVAEKVKTEKRKVIEPEEIKKTRLRRCYLLTETQIKRVTLLNLKLHKDKDLSDIVGMALDLYYETKLTKEERKFLEENF